MKRCGARWKKDTGQHIVDIGLKLREQPSVAGAVLTLLQLRALALSDRWEPAISCLSLPSSRTVPSTWLSIRTTTRPGRRVPANSPSASRASAYAPTSSSCHTGTILTATSSPALPPPTSPTAWNGHNNYRMRATPARSHYSRRSSHTPGIPPQTSVPGR